MSGAGLWTMRVGGSAAEAGRSYQSHEAKTMRPREGERDGGTLVMAGLGTAFSEQRYPYRFDSA